MSKCIKIRIKDFYKDAVGETEYTYVTEEVYEALVNTFRKETHAEEMRDLRHITVNGYVEGMTTREIADKLGVSQNVVWKSIRGSINTLKKFFE